MLIGVTAVYVGVAVVVFIATVAIFFTILWRQQGPI
jgi:hypothetical protein